MGWFSNLFGLRRADPAQQMRYVLPYPVSGVRLTPDEALSLSAVWACIDAIAKAIASCQWNIYQPTGPGRRDLLSEDPLSWVLNTRPNPEMTAIGFREAMLYTAIPFGNAYAEIVRDRGGRVAEIWPLEGDRVIPRRDRETQALFYEYAQPDGGLVRLDPKQVFHLRGPSLSGFLGDNLVARAAKSLSVAAAAERFSASFFGRGASPSGVLKFPGKLAADQHQRLKDDWAERKQGPDNAHKPLILEAGMTWESVSVEPGKSQLVESRQFSVEEICRWFGVPPHKVQHLLHATFSNIEHSSLEFVRDALSPWARRLEQEADFKLFRQDRAPWRKTGIDLAPLSYGDALSRAQAHAVWRQNGIMTANEIRHREGMNDAGDDGDVLLVQANLTTVQKILAPPAPAPGVTPVPDDGETTADEAAEMDPSVEEETPEEDAATATARTGLTVFMSAALDRYSRRIGNRRADLQKRLMPGEIEAHLTEERERLRPWLALELAPAATLATQALGRALTDAEIRSAADMVDRGSTPMSATVAALSSAAA